MLGEAFALFDESGNDIGLGDTVMDCSGAMWTIGGVDAVLSVDREKVLLSVLLVRSLSPYQAFRVATKRGTVPMHFKA